MEKRINEKLLEADMHIGLGIPNIFRDVYERIERVSGKHLEYSRNLLRKRLGLPCGGFYEAKNDV